MCQENPSARLKLKESHADVINKIIAVHSSPYKERENIYRGATFYFGHFETSINPWLLPPKISNSHI